jgi:hypothetical protein
MDDGQRRSRTGEVDWEYSVDIAWGEHASFHLGQDLNAHTFELVQYNFDMWG